MQSPPCYSKCSTRYVVRVTVHTESLTWSLTHNNTHYVYAGEILIWVPCERPPLRLEEALRWI